MGTLESKSNIEANEIRENRNGFLGEFLDNIINQCTTIISITTNCLPTAYPKYFGNIASLTDSNLEKLMVTERVESRRTRGKSPMRWTDLILNNI